MCLLAHLAPLCPDQVPAPTILSVCEHVLLAPEPAGAVAAADESYERGLIAMHAMCALREGCVWQQLGHRATVGLCITALQYYGAAPCCACMSVIG
jgi:hypothetical protein